MPFKRDLRYRQGVIDGRVIGRHGSRHSKACSASIRICPNRNRTYGFWTPGSLEVSAKGRGDYRRVHI